MAAVSNRSAIALQLSAAKLEGHTWLFFLFTLPVQHTWPNLGQHIIVHLLLRMCMLRDEQLYRQSKLLLYRSKKPTTKDRSVEVLRRFQAACKSFSVARSPAHENGDKVTRYRQFPVCEKENVPFLTRMCRFCSQPRFHRTIVGPPWRSLGRKSWKKTRTLRKFRCRWMLIAAQHVTWNYALHQKAYCRPSLNTLIHRHPCTDPDSARHAFAGIMNRKRCLYEAAKTGTFLHTWKSFYCYYHFVLGYIQYIHCARNSIVVYFKCLLSLKHTHTPHTHTHIYIYVCVCVCVCIARALSHLITLFLSISFSHIIKFYYLLSRSLSLSPCLSFCLFSLPVSGSISICASLFTSHNSPVFFLIFLSLLLSLSLFRSYLSLSLTHTHTHTCPQAPVSPWKTILVLQQVIIVRWFPPVSWLTDGRESGVSSSSTQCASLCMS